MIMKLFRLKVYTDKGLITSHWMNSNIQMLRALQELSLVATIKTVYMTDGKQSQQITFTQNTEERPIYFIRPDGEKLLTLSINPKNYPLTAVYSNGQTRTISL